MKKILSGTLGLLLGLTSFNALAQGMAESLAQMPPAEAMQLPADSTVRQGVLPNGLTYYIRHNETPKGQADFFIAQKVGTRRGQPARSGSLPGAHVFQRHRELRGQ